MSLSEEEIAFARDLFAGLGNVTTRKMFGGLSLYQNGTIFAVLRSDGVILIKGAGAFADVLRAEGCTQWREGKGTMPYFTLPDAALDDPEEACDWARRALEHL
ncbi:MAG: TfoX/Sxy family protein [Pseudomonadota bacterium]